MFSQYFGNYLLNKELITIEQYKNVMNLQQSIYVKIGILAVNSGLLTATQVDEIHHMQTRMDKRFGELAIEMGYLTQSQLEDILSEQQTAHLLLGQALIDKDYMTLAQIEMALNDYKRDYSLSDIQLKAIQNGDIDEIVRTYINFDGITNEQLYRDYISLFTRNIVRFISNDVRIEGFKVTGDHRADYTMVQNILGDPNLMTCIDADEPTFLKFASKYAEEELLIVDELSIESFGEFLNLHNGIFTVNESNKGVEYDLTPQVLKNEKTTDKLNEAVGVKIHLPFGTVNLIISVI